MVRQNDAQIKPVFSLRLTVTALTQQETWSMAGADQAEGGSSGSLGDGSLPVGVQGKAPVGGLGTSSTQAGDVLQNCTTMM